MNYQPQEQPASTHDAHITLMSNKPYTPVSSYMIASVPDPMDELFSGCFIPSTEFTLTPLFDDEHFSYGLVHMLQRDTKHHVLYSTGDRVTCLIDELRPYFGLPKCGSFWSICKSKTWVFLLANYSPSEGGYIVQDRSLCDKDLRTTIIREKIVDVKEQVHNNLAYLNLLGLDTVRFRVLFIRRCPATGYDVVFNGFIKKAKALDIVSSTRYKTLDRWLSYETVEKKTHDEEDTEEGYKIDGSCFYTQEQETWKGLLLHAMTEFGIEAKEVTGTTVDKLADKMQAIADRTCSRQLSWFSQHIRSRVYDYLY